MKRMEQFLIVVLLAGGTRAFFPVDETTCDLNANRCPCSPHLKGTVYIQCDVMANASGREVKCLKVLPKVNITVFSLKKENITIDKEFNNRLQFLIKNGTLKITNLRRNDSGQYSIDVFNSNGVQEKNILFTLDVKDNGKVEGLETCCDIKQNGAQCYGSLGGNVDIQLMDITSMTSKYQLMKNSLKILNVRNNKVLPNAEGQRFVFFPSNGTFRIPNMSRNDSGNYTLQTFDSEGRASGEWTLQLFIQAPVSSVLLVSECLSQREMRVSCSSEGGDSPQYSWTLDGRTLTDAELLPGNNETNIITLKQHVSGHLVCSVRNNVSNVSKEERISTCGFIFINCTSVNGTEILRWVFEANNTLCIKPTTQPTRDPTMITQTAVTEGTDRVSIKNPTDILSPPFSSAQLWYISILSLISAVLLALLILLVVGVAVIWAQRKKQNNKATKQKDEGDDQEVTYADVRVMKHREKEQTSEEEAEVEYGQVKFSKRPLYTEPTEDECLYANVKKSDDLSDQCFYTYCTTE